MCIQAYIYMYTINGVDGRFFFSARKYEQQQQPPKQPESVQLSVE